MLDKQAIRESRCLQRRPGHPTEWTLHNAVTKAIFQRCPTPHVDLFASEKNHKLPVFFSIRPSPSSSGVNTLTQNWKCLYGYAYPPTALIPRVLRKLRVQQGSLSTQSSEADRTPSGRGEGSVHYFERAIQESFQRHCRWVGGEGGHIWGILPLVAGAERADGHSCSRHQRGHNHLGGHRGCTV